jgi:hypothetical protein
MPSRLLISILFAGMFAIGATPAQEGITEVPVPRNVYGAIEACGADGQAYFSSIGDENFVLRASLDGSSLTFRLPKYANAVAPYAGGVNILSSWTNRKTFTRMIYHFDKQGNFAYAASGHGRFNRPDDGHYLFGHDNCGGSSQG